MAEVQDYVEPLSGEEVIVDVCALVAEALRKDCNLRPSDAYTGGYSGTVKVHLELYGMDMASVDVEVPVHIGKPQGTPDVEINEELEIPQEPALNTVRERSDQPVPTMVQEGTEAVVRPRRYVRAAQKVQGE